MPIPSGARLGPYEILALVGSGGMGEVYRARDTKLNRDVALKILPDAFASDPDRLARFTREAQTLAALNHPHIAHIYGLERLEGRGGRHGRIHTMTTTMDQAGRLVIPSEIRREAALQPGTPLEVRCRDGVIEIEPQPLAVKLERKGRLLVASVRPGAKLPVLRATTIERTRRTLAAGRGRR